jgi:ubiquinone biosynthesis protein
MNEPRTQKIQSGAEAGLKHWPNAVVVVSPLAPQASTNYADVVRPMPRRQISHKFDGANVVLPRARRVFFKASIPLTISRLFVWLWGVIRFFSGNYFDTLRRRDTVARRAARLRSVFENTGASVVKLGQQLSIRADLLPYAYCAELGKMLDRIPAFPTSVAIEIIERSLGRRLGEVFQVFDPVPIGSASLAVVFQARLRTGEHVAVKVRRPGIGPQIAADLRALDWLLIVAETLTIIPPGITRRFREEFQTILFNEMNFRMEGRYCDLFRRRSEKRGRGVTSPRVYFQYCTEEVLVSEFVSGVWMWEIMAAVDANDEAFLAQLKTRGIDPKTLAQKLVVVMHREVQEELFFHADPHPANIVIMPNNKICFIDFGAIGRFSTQIRKTFRELQHHMATGDIGRMVNCSLTLAGPLPPIDVEKIRWQIEKIYADWVYAQNSKDAEWWERSAAQAWLRFMEVAQEFALPVNFETIQYFRATFSYDAIVVRLNKDIDVTREWAAYAREAAKEARQRVQKNIRRRLRGPTDMDYLQLEQLADMSTQFIFQLQRNVEYPVIHFRNIVGKISFIASIAMTVVYWTASAIGLGLLADTISRRWFNHEINWAAFFDAITSFGWIQMGLIVILLIIIRRIVIRLNLPDSRLDTDRS